MNNKVQNPKIELDSSIEMNDENYLNDILETEKNMSVNFTYALNEASNETLFNEIYEMFKQIKASQRNLFELSFRKGFYTLEKGTKKGDKIGTLYINYNNETLDTINITSPEDIKFDFKFYVKEHKVQFVLLTFIATVFVLFINLRRIKK